MELHARVFGGELPVGLGVVFVSAHLPRRDFLDERILVGDAPGEALGGQDTESGFSHVQPASMLRRVMNLEPFRQTAGFRGGRTLRTTTPWHGC